MPGATTDLSALVVLSWQIRGVVPKYSSQPVQPYFDEKWNIRGREEVYLAAKNHSYNYYLDFIFTGTYVSCLVVNSFLKSLLLTIIRV